MADIDWEKGSMTPPAGGDVDWDHGDIQPPKKPAGVIRRIADMTAVPLAQGVIGVPEAVVGAADLVTNGQAGKLAEQAGFRPREAKQIIGDALYSDEQKAANQKVAEADGFFPTLQAAVENPSTIARTAVESLPSMFAGGAISRIARPVLGAMFTEAQLAAMTPAAREAAIAASGARDITAGAIGEGAISAGQNAEQVRQEEPTGTLTPQQAAYLGVSGGITGVISRYSGGAAAKLGIADPETALARGTLQTATAEGAKKAAEKGIARKAAEGFFTEGVLEELPQSWQEQVFQNLAQGKPWNEGAGNAAATGLLAGGITGAAVGPFSHGDNHQPPPPADKPLLLTHEPDPLLGFPDGTVARRSEAEAYLASLTPEQQAEARARMLGVNPQSPNAAAAAVPPAPPPAPMGPISRAAMLLPPAEHLPQPEPQGEGEKGASGEQAGASQAPVAAPPVDPNGGPISRAAALAQGASNPSVMGNVGSAPEAAQPDAQPASPAVPRGTPGFSHGPGDIVVDDHFEAAHTGATSQLNARPAPTEGQKEAENYPVGRTRVGGVGISIENGQGTERTGVDGDGKHWSTTMQDHYGRLLGTIGADSTPKKLQHIDVFVVPGTPKSWRGAPVIVDMVDPKTGLFDEHKVVFGAPSVQAGRAVIARNYNDGEARIGAATAVPFDTFKGWAYDGTQKSAPFDASVPTAHPGAAAGGASPGPEAASAGSVGGAQGPDLQAPAEPAAPAAPAQPARAALTPKQQAIRRLRSASWDKNPFLAFLADHGLYHVKGDPKSLKTEFSPDRQISVPGYHVAMFRRDGKQVDQLLQNAIEDGFLPHDADEADLHNLITRAMRGDRIIPAYAEGAIEQEVARRQSQQQQEQPSEDEEAAARALGPLTDEELAAFADADYDVPDLDAPSSIPAEAGMRAMGFTDEEIAHALRSEAESQPADATAPAARREGGQGSEQAASSQTAPAAASRGEAPAGQDLNSTTAAPSQGAGSQQASAATPPAASAAPAPATKQQATPPDRGIVELRKRQSVLRALRACVGGK